MKSLFLRLLAVSAFTLGCTLLPAQDLGAVRSRMEQRIPQIDTLKKSGALGENNRGFLEVRSASADADAVANAENADRRAVYSALAARTGATAEAVGIARAKQIAANSASGVWIQRENGDWSQK